MKMNFLKSNYCFKFKYLDRIFKLRNLYSQSLLNKSLIKNEFLEIGEEIRDGNAPIVALESTIITHGLPYPTNLETALEVEHEVRSNGAIPATIGFLNGKMKVGLTKNEIEILAKNHDRAIKLSRRDLAFVFGNKNVIGGTTVSATMIAANEANIPIFCTGGIGGVHRDWIDSMDVSADLQELARTPVAVVSSGVKSILDIEKTLEYLESMGVCVVSLNPNKSKEFPAFFTSKSGIDAPYNCMNELEAAQLILKNIRTGFNSGILIGNPIPAEYSVDENLINAAIQEALLDIKKNNIKGKKITPFLLDKINKLTKGKSLTSNVALIKSNARTSAKIAVELKNLTSPKRENENPVNNSNDKITVVGGINLDNIYKLKDEKTLHIKGVTQPTKFHQSLGGVGRNMSEALLRFGLKNCTLISTLGFDLPGRLIKDELKNIGFDTNKIELLDNVNTGTYFALFDEKGEIYLAAGSMEAHEYITVDLIRKNMDTLIQSEICIIDADIPVSTMEFICNTCKYHDIPVWYNPTDIRKCEKIIDSNCLSKLTYISPNSKELFILFSNLLKKEKIDISNRKLKDICTKYENKTSENLAFDDLKHVLKYMLKQIPFIILSQGENDLILASSIDLSLDQIEQLPLKKTYKLFKNSKHSPQLIKFPVLNLNENESFVNVTGAGDSTSSGIIAGICKNYPLDFTIYNGLVAAKLALMSEDNVSKKLDTIDFRYLKSVVVKQKSKIEKILL